MTEPRRVVLADDDAVIRDVLAELLGAADDVEIVAIVADAQAAIDACVAHEPDVAVLDVHMPGGGGVRAAREISRRVPRTRIVALTGDTDPVQRAELLAAGADRYVVKGGAGQDVVEVLLALVRDT